MHKKRKVLVPKNMNPQDESIRKYQKVLVTKVPKIEKVMLPKNSYHNTDQYGNVPKSSCAKERKVLVPKNTESSCGTKQSFPNTPNSKNILPKKGCTHCKLQPQMVRARPWGLTRSHASCMHESLPQLLPSDTATKAKPNTINNSYKHGVTIGALWWFTPYVLEKHDIVMSVLFRHTC